MTPTQLTLTPGTPVTLTLTAGATPVTVSVHVSSPLLLTIGTTVNVPLPAGTFALPMVVTGTLKNLGHPRITPAGFTELMVLAGTVANSGHPQVVPAGFTEVMGVTGTVTNLASINGSFTAAMTVTGALTKSGLSPLTPGVPTSFALLTVLSGAVNKIGTPRIVPTSPFLEAMTIAGNLTALKKTGGSFTEAMTVTGAVSALSFRPQPPLPPATYSLPVSYTLVHNTAELNAALAANPANIVLADGTYDNPATFSGFDSSLYAANLGSAILAAGLVMNTTGASDAPTIQGLRFNCVDASKTDAVFGYSLGIWDPHADSTGVIVRDCWFDSAKALSYGVWAGAAPNLTLERLVVSRYSSGPQDPVGLRLEDSGSGLPTYSYALVTDINVSDISSPVPSASNGTAEVGLWVGQPVIGGVSRIKARLVSLASIETLSSCANTVFSDLDLDMSGANQPAFTWTVGVYQEHYSVGLTFQNFLIAACHTGFTAEWDNGQITPITTLTTGFTQPAVGSSVTIAIGDTSWWAGREWVGMRIVGAGFYGTSIVDGTHMTVTNYGFPNTTAPGGTVATSSNISPGVAGAHFNTFKDGTIDATGSNGSGSCGIFGDQGTQGMTVQNVKFIGQTFAAVGAYNNLDAPTITGCTYNIPGAQFSTNHI